MRISDWSSDVCSSDLQVSWMAYYNANWLLGTAGRPATPKRFYSVVGTDVETAVWDSDSYCGGYTENLGLEVTQFWLASCSDGFLNCSSQSAAGSGSEERRVGNECVRTCSSGGWA